MTMHPMIKWKKETQTTPKAHSCSRLSRTRRCCGGYPAGYSALVELSMTSSAVWLPRGVCILAVTGSNDTIGHTSAFRPHQSCNSSKRFQAQDHYPVCLHQNLAMDEPKQTCRPQKASFGSLSFFQSDTFFVNVLLHHGVRIFRNP